MLENTKIISISLGIMIETIEKLRVKQSKASIARMGNISLSQYYNYLNGAEMPFKVVDNIIKGLGYKLTVIKEI